MLLVLSANCLPKFFALSSVELVLGIPFSLLKAICLMPFVIVNCLLSIFFLVFSSLKNDCRPTLLDLLHSPRSKILHCLHQSSSL